MTQQNAGPSLEVRNLVKRYGTLTAVDDVSFTVAAGSFLTLLGPSGSGKTSILRLVGGFETPDAGRIEIGGADVTAEPPHERNIGVVFQRYALFPHMTVAENVGFSLKQRGVPGEERRVQVARMLERVGMSGAGERHPDQLSGGQQQRVALARALVFEPRILVMDEPLAALDKHLRERLQRDIRSLQRQLGITTLYVTHDQTEALAMSDEVAIVNAGRIEQRGTPRDLYEAPATEFVARFMGSSNVLRGTPVPGSDRALRLADGSVVTSSGPPRNGAIAAIMVRPERMCIGAAPQAPESRDTLRGRITQVLFLGEMIEYRVAAAGVELTVREPNRGAVHGVRTGDEVSVSWAIADAVSL